MEKQETPEQPAQYEEEPSQRTDITQVQDST
jgi:hypothetical protein